MPITDREVKEAALLGLRHERQRMDEMIARLERELGSPQVTPSTPGRRNRRLSAAGRRQIVAALKKRWAAFRNKTSAPAKKRAQAAVNARPATQARKPFVKKPFAKKRASKPMRKSAKANTTASKAPAKLPVAKERNTATRTPLAMGGQAVEVQSS